MTEIATPLASALDNPPSFIDMPTKAFDYLTESQRTASGKFHGKFVDFDKFTEVLTQFMYASQQLDRYKKLLFYGEDREKGRMPDSSTGRDGYSITDLMSVDNETEMQARYILHALLGIMTEAGEMAEALHNTIVGNQPFDAINLIEECGDVQWYEAMLCRALGTDFDTIQRKNIAKLRARFPDKFTSENANVRDLEKERAILENGYGGQHIREK